MLTWEPIYVEGFAVCWVDLVCDDRRIQVVLSVVRMKLLGRVVGVVNTKDRS